MTQAELIFKLSFQISPIILTGGVAQDIPGGMLPIISLTENYTDGLLSGGVDKSLDEYFAHYEPIPGSTVIDFQYAEYPFANQSVAANAAIAEPLMISMLMTCPVRPGAGFQQKLSTFTSMQQTLYQHGLTGGTYTIATPAMYYSNCLLLRITDVTKGDQKQAQMMYKWDFRKPLLTQEDAQAAQNSMMSKISAGVQTDGSLSGVQPTIGSTNSLATMSVAPAASGAGGASIGSGSQYSGPLLGATDTGFL